MSLVVDRWESKCGCLIADRANKLSHLPHVLKGVGSKENSDDYVVGGFTMKYCAGLVCAVSGQNRDSSDSFDLFLYR